MSQSDLNQVLAWRNSESIRAVSFHDHIISLEEHLVWFRRVQSQDNSRHLIFEFGGDPAGVVNVTQINQLNGTCYWGFYIGPDMMRPGMGTAMGIASLNYIFGDMQIRKLCSEVLAGNEASIGFHEKLGFSREGLLREHVMKNAEYVDVICFGIFQREWEQQRERLI
jgi:UDP-4-amino-4,6-dideoxy-N-acetyl-beta-L-altrosamine N-acetyltransferase